MKRVTLSLIFAVAISVTASAQVPYIQCKISPEMDSLYAQLSRRGVKFNKEQTTHEGEALIVFHLIFTKWNASDAPSGENMTAEQKRIKETTDSVNKARDNAANLTLDAIRNALDQLTKTATESYHYETHSASADTIRYSMCINGDTDSATYEKSEYGENASYQAIYRGAKEAISFRYQNDPASGDNGWGVLHHTILLENVKEKAKMEFDADGFEKMVAKELKGWKSRKIHWQHPNVGGVWGEKWFNNYNNDYIFYSQGCFEETGYINDGDTHGIIFTLPKEESDKAFEDLARVSNETVYGYIKRNPYFYYSYTFNSTFSSSYTTSVFNSQYLPEGTKDSSSGMKFDMITYLDDNGFHILLLRTKGWLWIPRELSKLKSFVDGKKVYIK